MHPKPLSNLTHNRDVSPLETLLEKLEVHECLEWMEVFFLANLEDMPLQRVTILACSAASRARTHPHHTAVGVASDSP